MGQQTQDEEFDRVFRHDTVTANGVRLHVVSGGSGDPLLLLHGFTSTWYGFRRIMPVLARRYTVVAPDLRGLGDSERPASGYDKRTLAADIAELMRALGHGPSFVVGHDFGGQVAYLYAAMQPQAVRRLALLEALLPGIGFQSEGAGTDPRFWFYGFSQVPDLPEALVAGRERLCLERIYRDFLYDPRAVGREEMDEYVRTYAQPGAMRVGFELYRALPQDLPEFAERYKTKLAMPVLALGGAISMGPLVIDTVRQVATDVRGGVVERAGHYLTEERPEEMAQRLLEFFGEEAAAEAASGRP